MRCSNRNNKAVATGYNALVSLPHRWSRPFAFAPLEGVGHPAYLELVAAEAPLGLLGAPFWSVGRGPLDRRALERHVASLPVSGHCLCAVQLLGADPERMALAARWAVEAGARVVDVNLGCPARRVVARGAGAALLGDPERLYRLLARVRDAVPVTLSAKLRAGLEDDRLLFENTAAIEAAGVDFLTLHPRTAGQGYRGVANWQALARVVSRVAIPVVGNGDCWYAEDARRLRRETGCAAVMIGRPALRNPWIFEQLAALQDGRPPPRPAGRELVAWLERVASRLAAAFAPYPGRDTGKLKELVRYLGSAVPDGGGFRRAALRAPDTPALLGLARERLGDRPPEALDLGPDGPHRLMRTP